LVTVVRHFCDSRFGGNFNSKTVLFEHQVASISAATAAMKKQQTSHASVIRAA
jgi:hypothetical protein